MSDSFNKNNFFQKKTVLFGAGIVIVALIIRLIYLYEASKNPTFFIPIIDSKAYDMIARELVEKREMHAHFFYQAFFYPFFLSMLYLLSGSSIVFAKLIQIIIGSLVCLLTFLTGKKIFDQRTGVLAGGITAFYGPLIAFEGELLATCLASLWALILIYFFLRADEKKDEFFYFMLGICGGLSVVTRATFLPFFAAASIWLAYRLKQAPVSRRFVAGRCSLILFGFLFVLIPVSMQNSAVTGNFSPLPSSGALNLYMGNNPDMPDIMAIRPGGEWETILNLPFQHGAKDMKDANRYYLKQAGRYIIFDPIGFAARLARKTVHFLSSREIPSNFDMYLSRKYSKLFSILTWKVYGFGFPFGMLLPMAIIGLVVCWKKIPMPVKLFLVFYPAAVIFVFVTARYRAPVVPILAVLSAAGGWNMIEKIKLQKWTQTAMMAGAVVLIALLSSASAPSGAEKLNFEAEMYYCLGNEKAARGDVEEGITDFKKAIQLNPQYDSAYHNLGSVLFMNGRPAEAITYYMKALEINPDYVDINLNIGHTLLRLGRAEEAIPHYMEEARIAPQNPNAYRSLGKVFMQAGEREKAMEYYLKAFSLAKGSGNYVLAAEIKDILGEK